MLAWIAGTRIGRYAAAAFGLLLLVLGAKAKWTRDGKVKERAKNREKDQENAQEIENRVDDALRKHDGDTRPVDDRLRERGRLRDSD